MALLKYEGQKNPTRNICKYKDSKTCSMCWGRGEVLATVIYSAALTNVTCEMKSVLDAFQGHCLLIYLCLMTKPYAIQCTECKKNQRHIYPTIFSIVYFTLLVS